jgi:uncharacterized membrane protein
MAAVDESASDVKTDAEKESVAVVEEPVGDTKTTETETEPIKDSSATPVVSSDDKPNQVNESTTSTVQSSDKSGEYNFYVVGQLHVRIGHVHQNGFRPRSVGVQLGADRCVQGEH